ncbi:B-cell receptor CD22-like [Amblyraja radiata]|uniref:B-cell receptor CD22-like n=1 Tax=Amblyraja radiata TaxID=386614 RepID=UPI001403B74B|nr:B-cell receptor CD22-like [Amblyraja radiata]
MFLPVDAPINVRITAPTAPPAGEYITLRCESQANPAVNSYSWRKLCGSQSTDLWRDGVEYRLRATVEVGTCDYFCTVRNYLGRTESPAQRIDVQYAPINVRITAPTAPPAGEYITLRCESQANPAVNSYSWRKLCGSQSTVLRRDGVEYRLRATVEVGTCDYFCTVRNYLGRTESPAQRIDVQYAPINVWITAPTAPPAGEYITLRCESQANPAVNTYSWRKLCGSQSTDLWRDGVEYSLWATE